MPQGDVYFGSKHVAFVAGGWIGLDMKMDKCYTCLPPFSTGCILRG